MPAEDASPFEQLDFLYMPSADVARDMTYFTDVLGGRVVFAVEGMGARVAAVALPPKPARLVERNVFPGLAPSY